jgi:DNA-damage-inducible protein D
VSAGIPDPGRESGYFAALERMQQGVGSTDNPNVPFDLHRRITAEGREYWSARDLQPLLDYTEWRKFTDAITRAKASGRNAGHDMSRHIVGAAKMVDIGSGAQRSVEDHHLSRLACYLIAMNGDPRKKAVADAQTYFAIRTREAETAAPRPLTEDEIVHQALAITARRVEELTAKVAELEPSAVAWDTLQEIGADYEVADAAKILSRDPQIQIGRNRLFEFMADQGWVYRGRHKTWKAYRDQVDAGRLLHRPGGQYFCKKHDELRTGDPTILITPKGLAELRRLLGGSGQLELVAAS